MHAGLNQNFTTAADGQRERRAQMWVYLGFRIWIPSVYQCCGLFGMISRIVLAKPCNAVTRLVFETPAIVIGFRRIG
jgi:hypothetical protein